MPRGIRRGWIQLLHPELSRTRVSSSINVRGHPAGVGRDFNGGNLNGGDFNGGDFNDGDFSRCLV